MRITCQGLTLRNAGPEDLITLARWWNDGGVMAHAGFPNGLGISEAEVAAQLSGQTDDTVRVLIIEVGGAPIGEMNYRNKGSRTAAIGIKVCETGMQGKGLGTLCLRMLITKLFQLGYTEIILDTNVKNLRAQHVYEKLGFEKLRVNHNHWQDQLGEWQSSVDYRLVASRFVPLSL
ncbi:MAG: GNAT family protein [Bacillota bacterium]